MVLLTNGDSWTQGDNPAQKINWEAKKSLDWYDIVPHFGRTPDLDVPVRETRVLYKFYESDVWPKVLGRQFGVETWNAGRLGDDNYNIALSTIASVEWLLRQKKEDIFVVVGWTSPLRVPVFLGPNANYDKELPLHIYQIRPYNNIPEITPDNFDNIFDCDNMSIMYIYTLQEYLKSKQIKFLFFNAFDSIQDLEHNQFNVLLDKKYWVHNNIQDNHFDNFIKKKFKLTDWENSKYYKIGHPTDIAHRAWGKFLHEYILKNES